MGSEADPVTITRVRQKRIRMRAALTHTITLRRSERSTMLPACSAKISHGKLDITPREAIRVGDRVNCAANKGSVTWYSPSPRFEKLLALQTFQKFALVV